MGVEDPIRRRIADRIRMFRMQRGLTEEEVARRADLPIHYVRAAERAQVNLTLSALESLARALELRAEMLFDSRPTRKRD